MIKLTKDIEIEVITHFDEMADHAESVDERFSKGDVLDVDILEQRETNTDFQFPNGDVAFCVDNDCFEVVS